MKASTELAAPRALPLYQVAAEIRHLIDDAPDGELTDQAIEELDRLEMAFHAKAESIALIVRERLGLAKALEEESRRLADMARAQHAVVDRLKTYLKIGMETSGETKITGTLAKLWVQRNGRPAIAWGYEVADLPTEFKRVRVELDGDAAYEAYRRDGALPDGFTVVQGTHLRIA